MLTASMYRYFLLSVSITIYVILFFAFAYVEKKYSSYTFFVTNEYSWFKVDKNPTHFACIATFFPKLDNKKITSEIKVSPQKDTVMKDNAEVVEKIYPKKTITLPELVKGFSQYIKKEKVQKKTLQKPNIATMTSETIKQQSYMQKIMQCCNNSYKIYKKSICVDTVYKVTIILALEKNGSIKQLSIISSSNNIHIDRFILFLLQDAAKSFPPIPKYLQNNPYQLVLPLTITARTITIGIATIM